MNWRTCKQSENFFGTWMNTLSVKLSKTVNILHADIIKKSTGFIK